MKGRLLGHHRISEIWQCSPINQILQGHAIEILRQLPSDSIDMCITSPPYWGLRIYGTEPQIWGGLAYCDHNWRDHTMSLIHEDLNDFQGTQEEAACKTGTVYIKKFDGKTAATCSICGAWRGELGLEPYFFQYVEHLCQVFDEVKRVLKPTGTCWINLGDTYSGSNNGSNDYRKRDGLGSDPRERYKGQKPGIAQGIASKSLCQIPSRFAIEMTNRGWILRNELIWWKPNCMPASVKDRFTVDFEKIFFFVKEKKYFFETQYEPWLDKNVQDLKRANGNCPDYNGKSVGDNSNRSKVVGNPALGRNKRCVWRISTRAFVEAHFAVYPPGLLETPIKAGCPEFVCKRCRRPKEKVYESRIKHRNRIESNHGVESNEEPQHGGEGKRFAGSSSCSCNAGLSQGIILDPFMGSGTTALAALQHNRSFVGIELNPEYIKMAMRRIKPLLRQKALA